MATRVYDIPMDVPEMAFRFICNGDGNGFNTVFYYNGDSIGKISLPDKVLSTDGIVSFSSFLETLQEFSMEAVVLWINQHSEEDLHWKLTNQAQL